MSGCLRFLNFNGQRRPHITSERTVTAYLHVRVESDSGFKNAQSGNRTRRKSTILRGHTFEALHNTDELSLRRLAHLEVEGLWCSIFEKRFICITCSTHTLTVFLRLRNCYLSKRGHNSQRHNCVTAWQNFVGSRAGIRKNDVAFQNRLVHQNAGLVNDFENVIDFPVFRDPNALQKYPFVRIHSSADICSFFIWTNALLVPQPV